MLEDERILTSVEKIARIQKRETQLHVDLLFERETTARIGMKLARRRIQWRSLQGNGCPNIHYSGGSITCGYMACLNVSLPGIFEGLSHHDKRPECKYVAKVP
jgi:hypothetical protein